MTVALPLPFEDEILFSVIGRYFDGAGVENPTTAITSLFGRMVRPNTEFMFNLSEVAKQTFLSWGMTAYEIVCEHTLVPYYTSYATEALAKRVVDVATVPGHTHVRNALGLNASSIAHPAYFRFCAQCIAQTGEAYFRRAHQLPGVFFCVRHGCPLSCSNVKLRPYAWTELCGIHESICSTPPNLLAEADPWVRNDALFEVAARSVALLTSRISRSAIASAESYAARANDVGLVNRSGYIDKARIRAEMMALYGEDYLANVGLPIHAGPVHPWPLRMMQKRGVNFQPLQHVLLDYYLEHSGKNNEFRPAVSRLHRRLKYICPNPYAVHGEGHEIERVKMLKGPDGSPVGSASCDCGFRFTFTKLTTQSLEPEILKVWRFGSDWSNAAKTMKRGGTSISGIEKIMNLPKSSVKALLAYQCPDTNKASAKKVSQWRREWEELLASIAPGGHKEASRKNSGLYRMLSIYDKEWLRASAIRRIHARENAEMLEAVDWASRDLSWCAELRYAAARLRASGSTPIRASKRAIQSEAGRTVVHRKVASKLPLCQAVLEEMKESVQEFQVRRLEFAAQTLRENGRRVSASALLHATWIPYPKLTPALKAVIERLTRLAESPTT